MSDKFYVSRGVWYPIGEQAVGPTGPDGAHVHADPKEARIAELEAALRPFAKLADCWEPTAEEGEQDIYIRYPDGFSTRVRVAIFLAARAALSTKEDGK